MYWKQRTKECFKIADAVMTEIFKIRFKNLILHIWDENRHRWVKAKPEEVIEIIKRDGFDNSVDFFYAFYSMYGDKMHDMEFMVIRWKIGGDDKNGLR